MGRGRSRFAQQGSTKSGRYGLTGVPRNSRIAVDMDAYRRGRPETIWTGTIVKRVSMTCWIVWDDFDEEPYPYPEGDVRYWVDSGRARIQQPVKETLITKMLKEKK